MPEFVCPGCGSVYEAPVARGDTTFRCSCGRSFVPAQNLARPIVRTNAMADALKPLFRVVLTLLVMLMLFVWCLPIIRPHGQQQNKVDWGLPRLSDDGTHIEHTCPVCKKGLRSLTMHNGTAARCPHCGAAVIVPNPW